MSTQEEKWQEEAYNLITQIESKGGVVEVNSDFILGYVEGRKYGQKQYSRLRMFIIEAIEHIQGYYDSYPYGKALEERFNKAFLGDDL